MQSRTWPSLLSRTASDRLLSGGARVRAKEAEVMGLAQGAEIRSTLEAVYEQLQRWAARSERPMWVWEEGRRLWHPLLEGA